MKKSMFLVIASLVWTDVVLAADTWTDPAPGVRRLVRTAPGPIRINAAIVDFSRQDLYMRVTRPEERGRTVSNFANHVGAVVAINGDWFSWGSYQPVGLAVGDGVHWEGTGDNGWSFLGCTIEKDCTFDDHTQNTARNPRWNDVVGGNGWRLLVDGNVPQYPAESFYNAREPRSGVGMSADGNTLIFVVVEGRRSDSIGVSFPQMGQIMKDLGAHQAMMLDGGGSSSLVINGGRVSNLPSGASERVVANHLAILRGAADPRCANTPNGRYCDGSVIHTCRGGQHMGQGDCGAFGAACEVTADGVGTCVHPYCNGGAMGGYCEDETNIVRCEYGQPGPAGDCSFFGATCEQIDAGAQCVHFECSEGGDATWCQGDVLSACAQGQPQENTDCAASGQKCHVGLKACVSPECLEATDGEFCLGGLVTVCEAGAATRTAQPCGVDSDDPDQPDVPVVPVDEVNDGEEPFQAEQDGGMESMTARGNASCTTTGGAAIVWLLGFVLLFRRRSFDRAPGMGAQS
ncbi:phosphodiester glycosidase family protein [Microvenator marinus]|uniref:Phosphodiester glycosidase family protein n=1 Tax=Microvenator marinus TaxID=2600177 RepID=A0A5B8XXY6_9DELT|nr:phosphodiester glycosidase family protein [Microvenator marinus]QED30047.1 phosphodiester glycosidase family protein [Microvenator marinus]